MNHLLRPFLDLRFQIEGCLIADWIFEFDSNVPLSSSVYFVLLGFVYPQIRNPRSAFRNGKPSGTALSSVSRQQF